MKCVLSIVLILHAHPFHDIGESLDLDGMEDSPLSIPNYSAITSDVIILPDLHKARDPGKGSNKATSSVQYPAHHNTTESHERRLAGCGLLFQAHAQ
jgi:hypothetical protein